MPEAVVDWWRQRKAQGQPIIPMYGFPERALQKLCRESNCVIRHRHDHRSTDAPRFVSAEYLVQKAPSAK